MHAKQIFLRREEALFPEDGTGCALPLAREVKVSKVCPPAYRAIAFTSYV